MPVDTGRSIKLQNEVINVFHVSKILKVMADVNLT